MKTLILKSCMLISLFLLIESVAAQRGLNQTSFKAKGSSSYQKQDLMIQTNMDEINNEYDQRSYYPAPVVQKSNEVVVNVRSLMNVKANKFLAVFNLTQVGETAVKTDELLNSRIDIFSKGLKQLGVTDKDIYVDMIYLIPTFEFEVTKKLFSTTYNEVPTGFEMQKNIHINFSDINKVDDIVTLAAKCEIYDLVKLDFFVENSEAVYDTLRTKSVDLVNKKLNSYKKLNLNLADKYHLISESSNCIYPETQYPDFDAYVSQSIEAVSKNTGVTKIRKPKTVAYDQKSYTDFDIVINPNILEPVVQFIYVLQVKYTVDKPEEKSKNNYLMVTPAGEVKKIELIP